MTEAVIVAARRTPIGRAFKGSLTQMRPDDLSAVAIAAALADLAGAGAGAGAGGIASGVDPGADVDMLSVLEDLYLGCAEPSAEHGSNMARVVAVLLGQDTLPGTTVNRFCASSLQTTAMAFHAIKAGEGSAFISAGVECVSRYVDFAGAGGSAAATRNPLFAGAAERTAATAQSNTTWSDPRADGLLPDAYIAMGQTAENVVTMRGMSRQRQDEWGVLSQNRAEAAIAAGVFDAEIAPVTLPDGTVVSGDDGPRAGVTYEKVSTLNPVFRPEGTITAGNCCPLNDGAAAVVVMSDDRAAELGLTPLARIVSTAATALSPEIMGLGPVEATRLALARAGMSIADMDLYEINEAFAVQVLASADDLGMDHDKLNVHGGAIALGHPFGATGARITTTLLNALKVHDGQFGLETMCVGGGQGMAMVLERL